MVIRQHTRCDFDSGADSNVWRTLERGSRRFDRASEERLPASSQSPTWGVSLSLELMARIESGLWGTRAGTCAWPDRPRCRGHGALALHMCSSWIPPKLIEASHSLALRDSNYPAAAGVHLQRHDQVAVVEYPNTHSI